MYARYKNHGHAMRFIQIISLLSPSRTGKWKNDTLPKHSNLLPKSAFYLEYLFSCHWCKSVARIV